jgi:hypothetical protein
MQIFYRVLSVDTNECAIEVRFWTDLLSEHELRTDPEDKNDPPLRCRTDNNINIWDPAMSQAEIHDYILSQAPVQSFDLKHKIKEKKIDTSLSQVTVGEVRTNDLGKDAVPNWRRKITPSAAPFSNDREIDISHLLPVKEGL